MHILQNLAFVFEPGLLKAPPSEAYLPEEMFMHKTVMPENKHLSKLVLMWKDKSLCAMRMFDQHKKLFSVLSDMEWNSQSQQQRALHFSPTERIISAKVYTSGYKATKLTFYILDEDAVDRQGWPLLIS